jgi:hypothetical protein
MKGSDERALRCAFALMDTGSELGLRLRAAVHKGEIEIPTTTSLGSASTLPHAFWTRRPTIRSS